MFLDPDLSNLPSVSDKEVSPESPGGFGMFGGFGETSSTKAKAKRSIFDCFN